ncbi:MAG: hypothetical protein ACREFW_06230 [Rhizomicrobium sp.]
MTPRIFPVAVFLVGLLAGLSPALAAPDSTRDAVLANVERCAGFTDNRTWLNCFYGAAQPMRAQLGLSPAPDSQLNLVKSAPQSAPPMKSDSGGGWLGIGNLFSSSSSDADFAGNAAMRLTAYSFGKDGLFTATLADGEVWRQSPYDDLRARWSGEPSNYIVIVSADMLGSHTMQVEGDHDYRVIRVK